MLQAAEKKLESLLEGRLAVLCYECETAFGALLASRDVFGRVALEADNMGNMAGDGVGYYFVEMMVPEPTSVVLCGLGIISLGILGGRRG